MRSIQKKWQKRLDEEKLLVRLFCSLTIFPIVGIINKPLWIGFVILVIYCLGEYILRKYMMRCYNKELEIAEIPMIEKYLIALWSWEKNKK